MRNCLKYLSIIKDRFLKRINHSRSVLAINHIMKKIIFYILILVVLISCSSDDDSFDEAESRNLISFELSQFFGDYFGDQRMLLYDLDQQKQIEFLTDYDYYDWHKNVVYYTKGLDLWKKSSRGDNRQIASIDASRVWDIMISPNEKLLAFSTSDAILVLELSSGGLTNITSSLPEARYRKPIWSANGSSLLMQQQLHKVREGDEYPTVTGNYFVYNIQNEDFIEVEMFDEFAFPGSADWFPDGNAIVYEQYGGIFKYNLISEQLIRMTPEELYVGRPKISPNGNKMSYFIKTRVGDLPADEPYRLAIMNTETMTNLLETDYRGGSVDWFQNSEKFILINNGVSAFDINTGTLENVIPSVESHAISNPTWIQ